MSKESIKEIDSRLKMAEDAGRGAADEGLCVG